MKTWIVMRAHDDMPVVGQTLERLARQRRDWGLVVFDDGSTDGTRQVVGRYADRVLPVPGSNYVPGRVLNRGMEVTQGRFVVFLNADCTPTGPEWLDELLAGFTDDAVAAVYGRQIPRPDCRPLYARDMEVAFGDGDRGFRQRFSMASAAIRRSVWEELRFDEQLQYSEDIDWTWRARRRGYAITYAPRSVAVHSHNYGMRQLFRRQYGEGRAEATIFEWSAWQRSLARYALLPYLRLVLDDWQYCLRRGHPTQAFLSPVVRMVRVAGRTAGFRAGRRERRRVAHLRAPRLP